jgi:hypothetical protein
MAGVPNRFAVGWSIVTQDKSRSDILQAERCETAGNFGHFEGMWTHDRCGLAEYREVVGGRSNAS